MNSAKKLIYVLSLLCLVPKPTHATELTDTLKLAAQICLFSTCSVVSSMLGYTLYNYIAMQYYQYLLQKQEKERILAGIANGATKKITFQDVAGAAVAKEELQDLVEYIKNPDEYTSLGATIPKGILLYGPPGTGKTLLAKATAGEAGCEFIATNGTDFVTMFIGTGAHNMAQIFAHARQKAPCIIFIDEIETIGKSRELYPIASAMSEYGNTLNQLLVEMDGFSKPDKPIIVIAATNRIDILDKAMLRPGRFDKLIYVPLPSLTERLDILMVHAQSIALADFVDLESIAHGTTGFSGAQLAELLKSAARIATKAKKNAVDNADLEEARDTIIMGAENKNLGLTDQDKKETAYHEAGHALVRLLLDSHGTYLHKVTIVPRGAALGLTWAQPERDRYSRNKDELETEIAVALGGRIAEELTLHQMFTGADSDFEKAMNIAREMVCTYGMSPELGVLVYGQNSYYSQKTADTIDQAIRTIIDTAYARTRELLTNNIDKLHLLAQELIEKETLSAEEIYTLLGMEPHTQQA